MELISIYATWERKKLTFKSGPLMGNDHKGASKTQKTSWLRTGVPHSSEQDIPAMEADRAASTLFNRAGTQYLWASCS